MNIEDSKAKTIYRNEKDGKVFYKLGMPKKNQDGNWEIGYIPCRFQKEVNIADKTKIILKNAWLDYWKKDKITNVYIFINKFEIVEDIQVPQNTTTDYQSNDIKLTDEEIKNTFKQQDEQLELPF